MFSRAYGFEVKRNIGQARDGGCDINVGPLVVECKRRKTLGTVYGWLQQAINAGGGVPVVVAREDQGEPIVILRLSDFFVLSRKEIEAFPRLQPFTSADKQRVDELVAGVECDPDA